MYFVSLPLGSTFHAIVSVIAVNIQLSSPNGVRLSFRRPGILEKKNDILAIITLQGQESQNHLKGTAHDFWPPSTNYVVSTIALPSTTYIKHLSPVDNKERHTRISI